MKALQTNIYVTDVCDRGCSSCYYPRNSTHMSQEMAKDVADWVIGMCKNEGVEQYKAHFLGGEPLNNLDTMLWLVERIESGLPSITAGHQDGKYVVFTNGLNLTLSVLDQLKDRKIRILLNPTYSHIDWVAGKMAQIKSRCGGVSLAVVADKDNLPRLPELTRLSTLFNGHIRINRLYNGGTIPGYIEEFRSQMHKVFDVLLAAEKPMWPNFIMESTYPLWEGPKNCHACGRWLLVVDPDGSVRSCNADTETKIGHIRTHLRMDDFHITHRWSSKGLEKCQTCEWANGGWCQGGCPFTRKLAYGTYHKETPFCAVFKELFPRLQELKEKWIAYKREM